MTKRGALVSGWKLFLLSALPVAGFNWALTFGAEQSDMLAGALILQERFLPAFGAGLLSLVLLVAATGVTVAIASGVQQRTLREPLLRIMHWRGLAIVAVAMSVEFVAGLLAYEGLPYLYGVARPLDAVLYWVAVAAMWTAGWLSALLLATRVSSSTHSSAFGELLMLARLQYQEWLKPVLLWTLSGIALAQGIPTLFAYLAWSGPLWAAPGETLASLVELARNVLLPVWIIPAAVAIIADSQRATAAD